MTTKLRFVLIRQGERLSIFVSTDLTLEPMQIITAYGYRLRLNARFEK